ncbi:MAG: pilus assembly protein [Acidobacteriia bacterium]|nr:pilus assembly protein [Terriglobia bacterium]
MASPCIGLNREPHGQAMVETALILPLLLGLVFNVINFGFFFLVALNITAAPRSGVLYSILGSATPINVDLATAGPPDTPSPAITVSGVTLQDLNGALANGLSAGVQVCTAKSGTTSTGSPCTPPAGGSGVVLGTVCTGWNGSPSYTPACDPEAPSFVLNRVDITYTFSPPLDQRLFNLVLLATPICTGTGGSVTCTFHRQVSMRVMN